MFKQPGTNGRWNLLRRQCEYDEFGDYYLLVLYAAIDECHYETVDWVHSLSSTSSDAIVEAAGAEQLEMLKNLLSEWYKSSNTKAAMDIAAANNHLDVVLWLHENRSDGCGQDAMDNTAANSYLDMVKRLDLNAALP